MKKETEFVQSKELVEELKQKTLITHSTLKSERGWSDKAIEQLLGQCDKDKPNPYSSSGPRMKLYLRNRVLAAEATFEFAKFKEAKERRRFAQIEAAKRKQSELLRFATDFCCDIPRIEDYRQLACDSYNKMYALECYKQIATVRSKKTFLDRISVNFLLHELSNYRNVPYAMREVADIIKGRIFSAIARTYPELRNECMAQRERANSDERAA